MFSCDWLGEIKSQPQWKSVRGVDVTVEMEMDFNKMTVHSDIRLLLIEDTLIATHVLLCWECVTVNNKMI